MQALVGAHPVAGLALPRYAEGVVEELDGTAGRLLAVAALEGFGLVEECLETAGAGHQQVAQVAAEGAHEVQGIEALAQDFVEQQQGRGIVSGEEGVDQAEVVFEIDHPQVADDVGVLDVGAAERHALVEEGEGVAHGAVGLLRYYVEAFVVYLDILFLRYVPEIAHHVGNGDTVEVVGLAARKDGGENLVLFGGAEDEDGVCGRLLEGFEEGVEGLRAEHVHLVDYIHAVPAHLRRDLHLLEQGADVFDAVV